MEKNKMKKIILGLCIIVIIIILLIGIILMLNKKQEKDEHIEEVKELEEDFQKTYNKFEEISNIEEYIYIKDCVNKYINYSNEILYFEDGANVEKELVIERLKSILPSFVIEELDIKNNTIYEKVGAKDRIFRADKIYKSLQTLNTEDYEYETDINSYYVEGVMIDKTNYSKEDIKIVIILDKKNGTFLLLPEQYLNAKNIKIEEGQNFEIYKEKEIKNEYYNIFDINIGTIENICKNYFMDFKNNILYDNEYLYGILEDKYKETKFSSFDEFKTYIKTNYSDVGKIRLEKFAQKQNEDNIQYMCQDQNGDMYIFYEKQPLHYKMILDTYEIDTAEFLEKYNKSRDEIKVGLNMEKVLEAINHKDYEYVYNKLDESYRNNTFGNLQQFEQFIKTKFYNRSDLEYLSNSIEGNVHMYTIKIKDMENEENSNQTRIMMKLKEGTDFILTFEM